MTAAPEIPRRHLPLPQWFRRVELCFAAILVCHLPMVWVQFQRAWQIEYYRFYPLVLLAIVGLFIHRWRDLPGTAVCCPGWASLATLLVGWGLLVSAVVLRSPWLGTVSFLVSLLAVLLSFGNVVARRLLPVWLLLWLLLPLPFRWDQRLVLFFQDFTSEGGSRLLDLWGVNHILAGFVLELPGRQLPVEKLCGSMASLFAAVSIAALLAVWFQRSIIHGVLLIASGAVWGLAINMIGVALMVTLLANGRIDVTSGANSWWFGAALFAGVLLMLLSFDGLLQFFFESPLVEAAMDDDGELVAVPVNELDEPPVSDSDALGEPRYSAVSVTGLRLLTVGFLATIGWQWLSWDAYRIQGAGGVLPGVITRGMDRVPWADVVTANNLPPLPGNWRLADFGSVERPRDSDLGHFSLTWRYAGDRDEALVSLDYPFDGWHEPSRLYEMRGWEIESRRVLVDDEPGEPVLEVRMRDAGGRRAYLLVRQFTECGEPISPPVDIGWSLAAWYQSLGERVSKRFGGSERPVPATLQVSLLITGDLPLETAQQAEARQAFRATVDRVVELLW
jgi:exosortase